MGQYLRIVVHDHHCIAVRRQVIHDTGQPLQVVGMKADGGLIQHIEDAGGPVADRPGQLYALAFSRGQRGGCAVQGQIAQAQIYQTDGSVQEGFHDISGHGAHGFRQRTGHSFDPGNELREGHGSRLVEADSAKAGSPGHLGKPRSVTIGTDSLLEEALDPLHPLLVLDFGQGIFHGVDRVKISKIHFCSLFGLRVHIKDMLLFSRAVVDHLLFFVGEVFERHVRTHAHLAAHVLHQGPHESPPDYDRSLVDGKILIGHKGRLVDRAGNASPAAGRTCPAAVEGQFLRSGPVKACAANRADGLPHGRHIHGGLHIVAVGTAVAGKA